MSIISKKLKGMIVFRMDRSMFKDVGIVSALWSGTTEKLLDNMNSHIVKAEALVRDPSIMSWQAIGFSPIVDALPFYEEQVMADWEDLPDTEMKYEEYSRSQIFVPFDNGQLFCIVEFRDRVVPGDTIRAELDKSVAELESRNGEPISRKERMELKDVVIARELATAKIRPRQIPVLIQQSEGDEECFDFIVFNATRKAAEDVTMLFRRTFGSWPVYPFENDLNLPLTLLMTETLKDPQNYGCPWRPFVHSNMVKMTSMHKGGGQITLKDEELEQMQGTMQVAPTDRVRDILDEGYLVERVRYRFFSETPLEDRGFMSFNLAAKGQINGIKFSDGLMDTSDDDNALMDFHAFMFVYSDQIGKLLAMLQAHSAHLEPDREKYRIAPEPEAPMVVSIEGHISDEPLLDMAAALVRETGKASISGVQRHFRIGYNRATRIIEQLEEMNVVTAPGANGSRTVVGFGADNEEDENDQL